MPGSVWPRTAGRCTSGKAAAFPIRRKNSILLPVEGGMATVTDSRPAVGRVWFTAFASPP